MDRQHWRRFASVFCLTGAVLCACAEDAAGPVTAEDVVGSYEATTFIGLEDSQEIDVLAEGGSLSITLAADGTTAGSMLVPGGDDDGSDLTADLAGSWSLVAGTVGFEHAADTFIRDVVWEYDDGVLRSESEFARVVLTR